MNRVNYDMNYITKGALCLRFTSIFIFLFLKLCISADLQATKYGFEVKAYSPPTTWTIASWVTTFVKRVNYGINFIVKEHCLRYSSRFMFFVLKFCISADLQGPKLAIAVKAYPPPTT